MDVRAFGSWASAQKNVFLCSEQWDSRRIFLALDVRLDIRLDVRGISRPKTLSLSLSISLGCLSIPAYHHGATMPGRKWHDGMHWDYLQTILDTLSIRRDQFWRPSFTESPFLSVWRPLSPEGCVSSTKHSGRSHSG